MVEIETPDAEELGGNVTKPFKFVTGMNPSVVRYQFTLLILL